MALHFVLDEATTAAPGDAVVLTGAEAHHAASVRRVRVGEEITVGDGRGAWLTGRCEAVAPREVVVRIESRTDAAPPRPRIVLVQALAKGDRDELAIQAATELGVDDLRARRVMSRQSGLGMRPESRPISPATTNAPATPARQRKPTGRLAIASAAKRTSAGTMNSR